MASPVPDNTYDQASRIGSGTDTLDASGNGTMLAFSRAAVLANLGVMPPNVTPVNAPSGNVANAVAAAALPAVAGKTNYLNGFEISGSGATAGLPVAVTITGLLGGTLTYIYSAAIGALVPNTPLNVKFPTPIPASAVNTAITISCPALGLGNTNNSVNAHGFVL